MVYEMNYSLPFLIALTTRLLGILSPTLIRKVANFAFITCPAKKCLGFVPAEVLFLAGVISG